MSIAGAAPRAANPTSDARAEASRRNGARSRGPKTPEGKARSAQNALKHGLRAQKYLVLPQEDGAEFQALEAALVAELAPVGALQVVLARRVVVAAWRLARADRIEADLFEVGSYGDASPGLALVRDGNGTRSFETLLRYRGAAMAEFWRALRTLKALQSEARDAAELQESARSPALARALAPASLDRLTAIARQPNEPESHGNSRQPDQPRDRESGLGIASLRNSDRTLLPALPLPVPGTAAQRARPIEPEGPFPGGFAPALPTRRPQSR